MAEHYAGDDSDVPIAGRRRLAAFAGMSVEDFEARSDAFLRTREASDARPRLPRRAPTRR